MFTSQPKISQGSHLTSFSGVFLAALRQFSLFDFKALYKDDKIKSSQYRDKDFTVYVVFSESMAPPPPPFPTMEIGSPKGVRVSCVDIFMYRSIPLCTLQFPVDF